MGSITINSTAQLEYLENDNLFTKTTTQLIHGWEWGAAKASASESDDPIPSYCCGVVTPPPTYNPSTSDPSVYPTGPGAGSRNPAGCGDCENSERDAGDDYMSQQEIAECKSRLDDFADQCVTSVAYTAAAAGTVCGVLPALGPIGFVGGTICGTTVASVSILAGAACKEAAESAKAQQCTN